MEYFMIPAVSGIFCLVYVWKKEYGYKWYFCLLCYMLTRFLVVAGSTNSIGSMVWNLCVDIGGGFLLFGVLETVMGKGQGSRLLMLYIFWPGNMAAVITGDFKWIVVSVIAAALYVGLICRKVRLGFHVTEFMSEYAVGALAGWLIIYAEKELGQRAYQIWRAKEDVPMVWILGAVLIIAAVFSIVMRKRAVDGAPEEAGAYGENPERENPEGKKQALPLSVTIRSQDGLIMIIGTLLFFTLALFRLGTTTVPATERHMTAGTNNEIILDFGERVKIARVEVFLGYESKRVVSFSVPEDGKWKVIKSRQELQSVFSWNEVSLNSTQRYLGCKFLDAEAYVREMVFFDAEGNKVLPRNALDYEELFDEQNRYPEEETYYYRTMFDEVYHARTAYEFLKGYPIYENTHPPLGKSIISVGIALFGMNPFGWRFMGVLCGTMVVPFLYLFALRLTGKTKYACLTLVLSVTEFMHFTLSRIATLDSIVALFIVAMFYFMYAFMQTKKKRYLLADGVAMGIAVSVKWTGVYAAAGVAVLFALWYFGEYRKEYGGKEYAVSRGRLIIFCVMSYIIIPAVLYVLSYIPFTRAYPDKNIIQHAIANAKLMFNYHKVTVFEHPYSSEWYEWIIDRRSLLDAHVVNDDGMASCVATLAGPVVCFLGLAALIYMLKCQVVKKDKPARFLVVAYASGIVPWMFIHRTVFIYHYLPCLNILTLMIPYALYLKSPKHEDRYMLGVAAVSVLLFVLFYPVLSGMSVFRQYIDIFLEWFPGWHFA